MALAAWCAKLIKPNYGSDIDKGVITAVTILGIFLSAQLENNK
jgi:hypothetical protein